MEKRSLGLVETWGYTPAIEAADAGSKAANVTLLGYEEVSAGLVTVKFVGDVAAVKAAVSAARTAAGKVGKVVAVHVIPRPDRQLHFTPPAKPPPVAEDKADKPVEAPVQKETGTPSSPEESVPAEKKEEESTEEPAPPTEEAEEESSPEPPTPSESKAEKTKKSKTKKK